MIATDSFGSFATLRSKLPSGRLFESLQELVPSRVSALKTIVALQLAPDLLEPNRVESPGSYLVQTDRQKIMLI
jgi:hypothetical protein